MGDEKQSQGSGKPNKFNEQNKQSADRKAADKNSSELPKTEPKPDTAITEPTKKP